MNHFTHSLRLTILALVLTGAASAVSLDAPVSSNNLLEPGPVMPTTELRLAEWETISLTTLIDGRQELVARAKAGAKVNAHFTNAAFTLTSAPPGIEVVDGVIDSAVNAPSPRIKQPPSLSLLLDTITLRAPAGTFSPEATFFAALSGPGFTWQVTAAELPVLASGVFVVEDLFAGLDYGYPFSGRRALDDDNNNHPYILEKVGAATYRYVFPGLETAFPPSSEFYGPIVGGWAEALKNSDETNFFTPFIYSAPTDPELPAIETHPALVLISDPVRRAQLTETEQALLPPAEDLPRQFTTSGGYYAHMLPNGHTVAAFNITLNMADPPPLNVPPHALIQSGTLTGAYGTSESENGPPDTLGASQGDPTSPNGENGLIAPQYWPQQGVQITEGLEISGQASLRRIKGRVLFSMAAAPPGRR